MPHNSGRNSRALARKLTEWSEQLTNSSRRFVVCSGGGPGIMEAATRGAADAGGKSISTPSFPSSSNSHPDAEAGQEDGNPAVRLNFEALVRHGMISADDPKLFQCADNVGMAFEILKEGLMPSVLPPETPATANCRNSWKPAGA